MIFGARSSHMRHTTAALLRRRSKIWRNSHSATTNDSSHCSHLEARKYFSVIRNNKSTLTDSGNIKDWTAAIESEG